MVIATGALPGFNDGSPSLRKGGIEMDQKASDRAWRQLESNIEGFLGQALRNDMPSIEYKPRFIVPLLAAPSEHHKNINLQETAKRKI
jgi:hypothetical protein